MTRRSLFRSLAGVVAGTVLAKLPLAGRPVEGVVESEPDTYCAIRVEWKEYLPERPPSVLVRHRIEAAKARLAKNIEAYAWGGKPEIDGSPPPGLAGLV